MIPSLARMMSSARETAWGFSILAMIGARVYSRSSMISSGLRTKLGATMSTPIFSPASRWARSSWRTAGSSSTGPGMFSPWREVITPPISTSASSSPASGRVAVTRSRTAPSER